VKPPNEREFDIITDPRFKSVNAAFNSMLKKARQEGKGQVVHKKPITEGKLNIISEYMYPLIKQFNAPYTIL
jgi:hypothetical protein